jgi:hypothetical protein
MKTVLTTVVAVAVGIITAFLLLIAVELFSAVVHPVPEGFGHTPEEMCRHVENYPNWVLMAVVPMWGATAFVSVWLAGKIGHLRSVFVVGTLLLAAVTANIAMLPYPSWFRIASPLAALVAIAAAGRMTVVRTVATEAVNPVGKDLPSDKD